MRNCSTGQIHGLGGAGCPKVFTDKQSGRDADRPDLAACLATLSSYEPGPAGQVPAHLITWWLSFAAAGPDSVPVRGAGQHHGPATGWGFHIFAALAEFFRELIAEDTHEGLAAAKPAAQNSVGLRR